MQRRVLIGLGIVFLVLVLSVLVAACGASQQEPAMEEKEAVPASLDGKALAEERCVGCHGYNQVETAKKTPEEWKANVERMVGHGAKLNEDEQAAVIEYLAEAFPK